MFQESGEEEDGEIVDTTGTITEEIDTISRTRIRTEEEDITEGMGSRTNPTDQQVELEKDGEGIRIGMRTRSRNKS